MALCLLFNINDYRENRGIDYLITHNGFELLQVIKGGRLQLKTLFKINFETDTYELKGNNLGKEVLLQNNKIISSKRNLGFGNKYFIECSRNGKLLLEFKMNLSTTSCEIKISKDDTLLAEYNETLGHLTPKWAKDKPKEETHSSTARKLIYSIGSIALAVIIWGLIYSWTLAPLLVAVVLLHELGHLTTMAVFGYKNKGLIFAPPLGAIAIGNKENAPTWQRFIVYLSGPLPGILLAFTLLYFNTNIISSDISIEIITMLLFINYFNLLPISPLDGGFIVELMFLHKTPKLQLILAGIGAVFIAILGIVTKNMIMLIVAASFGFILMSRINNKDKDQAEAEPTKTWVRWIAAIIYLGLWSIALFIVFN